MRLKDKVAIVTGAGPVMERTLTWYALGLADHGLEVGKAADFVLLERDGQLGGMLNLSERLEQSDFPAVAKLLARLRIKSDSLIAAQLEAIQWTNAMDEHV